MSRLWGLRAWICAAVLPLVACSSVEPLPRDEAAAHYEQVRREVITALDADVASLTTREEPVVQTEAGNCIYDPGSWEPDGEIFAHDPSSWKPLIDPLHEVLNRHGFETVEEFSYTNGEAFGISVIVEHGLQLRVYILEGDSYVAMHGAHIDGPGDCRVEDLGM